MSTVFKNPWIWLGVLFLALVFGIGIVFFGENSTTTVENGLEDMGGEVKQEKLSKEISDELVKKLEEDNNVPEEKEDDQISTTPENERVKIESQQSIRDDEQEEDDEKQDSVKQDFSGVDRLVSFGFSETNNRKIDTIVLHSTYNALGGDPFSVSKIIDIYKSYGVAPHYLISRDGAVYRLVEEKNIAYHAGESEMPDGRKNVNDFSIGVEIIGKDDGSPSDEQYTSLEKLLMAIKSRNKINFVLGHSDIALGRKTDPWGFEWSKIQGKKL